MRKFFAPFVAAGLSVAVNHLDAFIEAFTEHANANINDEQLVPALRFDCDARLHELDRAAVTRINRLSPFGQGNRKPALRITDAVLADAPRPIGANGKHLALRLRQDDGRQRSELRAVWWNAGEYAADLAAGMPIDAVIEPKLNAWNGRVNVEAELRDIAMRQREPARSAPSAHIATSPQR